MVRASVALLVTAAWLAPPFAQSAAEHLRMRRTDETNCGWLQNYTQIKLEGCLLNKGDMLVIPARAVSKAQALDLMATAAVAAEMNRKSPTVLSVALSSRLDRVIRVKGDPVVYRAESNPKEALRNLAKSAVECTMKDLETRCAGEQPGRLVPVR